MALKDKAAKIDLSQIQFSSNNRGLASKTAIGIHAEALFRDEKVSAENAELKNRLAEFDGANATRKIDPNKIKSSRWANRHEKSFETKEFVDLKNEIESAGGNIQPIKVRPSKTLLDTYEIIFGHRRHRACLELGFNVLAVIEDISDTDLYCQMDRENRSRAALTPWECGVTYARALDEGLFRSARKLAEAVSVDISLVSKALILARLPVDVISAFPNPLDLQYRWATLLTQSLQKNPDLVLIRAAEIRRSKEKLSSAKVLARLLEGNLDASLEPVKNLSYTGSIGQTVQLKLDQANRSAIINFTNFDPKRFLELENAIKALIA